MATNFIASRPERNARVLLALGEPGGGRRLEMFASARLALSSVGERAGLVLSLLSNASQPFARVLLALGEAGCGLALGQSSIARLARHCVGSRAWQKTICFAGPQRHPGRWAVKPDELRRLTSQSKGCLRAAHYGAPHWRRYAFRKRRRECDLEHHGYHFLSPPSRKKRASSLSAWRAGR